MPAMHAGVVSRNLQREKNQANKQGPPLHPHVPRSGGGAAGSGKAPTSRQGGAGKGKGKKGKKGKKDQYDLIVNIDLSEWQLTDEQVAEFKEVFMLFDKDEDGVLTFPELNVVMKSLGQRPSEKDLLKMVRDVSEDQVYDTIEFNEFLQMMSKQQRFGLTEDSLKDAFKIFDKDDDGYITVDELRHIMQSLGEKMTEKELDEMVGEADHDRDGLINYEEFVRVLCTDSAGSGKDSGSTKKKKKKVKNKSKRGTSTVTIASNNAVASSNCADAKTSSDKENMTNDNEDATDADPGNTAAALANAATICNEVIVATGTSNEDFAITKVPPTSSVPAESTKESIGNKKQISVIIETKRQDLCEMPGFANAAALPSLIAEPSTESEPRSNPPLTQTRSTSILNNEVVTHLGQSTA